MRREKANLEFEETGLLLEVIEKYNWMYRNTSRKCDLNLKKTGIHELTITDDGNLIPYGIFEIGTYIGNRLIYDNYRIKLTGWRKLFHETVHESEFHPQEEKITLTLKENEEVILKIKSATGINSGIGNLKPFLMEKDFLDITEFSQFKEIKYFETINHQTRNNLRINYTIIEKYLLIFGVDLRYGENFYRVDLESVFEINKPEHDF
jgi:hypothetical protein